MFVAKFNTTTGSPFKADKNGNMPMIGDVLAGTAHGTIINGTMFNREGLLANKLYLCENTVDDERPDLVQVKVICEVSGLEFQQYRTMLGAGKIDRTTVDATTEEEFINP